MKCAVPPLRFVLALLIATPFSCLLRAGDWPQWRGPNRNGYANESTPLTTLPAEPAVLWKIPVGGGFAGPVLAGKTLILLDESGDQEYAHALNTGNGRELWKVPYSLKSQDEWGAGPRATPMVDGSRVYVQSCRGEFRCLNLEDGRLLWGTSYETNYGVKFLGGKANEGTASRRGHNGTGVIVGDHIILPVGNVNGATLVCADKLTGKEIWRTGKDETAYSSLMVATLAGVRQVVAFTADALMGADLRDGKILWRVPLKTNAKRHASTPVIWEDYVAVNSHSIGLICFKITASAGGLEAKQAWANKDLKINLATPVLVDGNLYCQGARRDYICAKASTGALLWSHAGFGDGRKDYSSSIVLGKNLLVLTENGTLLLLACDPAKYTELGRFQACGNTWCFPAYANGKLYVRDTRQLVCLDLTSGK